MNIKTNITMVTTFHKEGLDLYGQRFLHSFEKHVDKKIDLLVYAEDCQPEVDDPVQIHILDAKQELSKLNRFKEKWKDVPKANGTCPFPERRPRDYHKEFKWHAIRFANKVYAVFNACERSTGWCIWIDADTYVHSNWSFEQLQELLPNDKWITYVGRGKGSQTWPECGFYGLNLNNQTCKEFLKEFINDYPEHELTGSAHYWLGEINFLKKEYREAALVFAEGYQKYPESKKAPDSLYKLAESLIKIEKKDEACETLNQL